MIERPWHARARELQAHGHTPIQIAELLQLSARTVRRYFDPKQREANVRATRKSRLKRRRSNRKLVRAQEAARQRRLRERRRFDTATWDIFG